MERFCDRCQVNRIGVGDAYHSGHHSWGLRLCSTCYHDPTAVPPDVRVLVRTLEALRKESAEMYYGECPIYPKPPQPFYSPWRVRWDGS